MNEDIRTNQSETEDASFMAELFSTEDEAEGADKGVPNLRELFEQIESLPALSIDQNDENEDMGADDYHNQATEHARHNRYMRAAELCIRGEKKHPGNIDLLADVVKFASDGGDKEVAQEYFKRLYELPRASWNWRAFTFSLDFLMERATENEELCRELIAEYRRYLPFEEKSYVAESELEQKLGNHDRSIAILRESIRTLPNAPQSALRLANMQLERGYFEEVIQTTNYAFVASVETQPSINISYMVFVKCLAEDALLHQRLMNGEPVTQVQIDHIRNQYETIQKTFPVTSMVYKSAIEGRSGILAFATPTA